MPTASGNFDVTLTPQDASKGASPRVGRVAIEKTFHGDLEGTSKGEMLAAGTAVADSAGYVAIEHVVGTLAGRGGEFVLQHTGVMARGARELTVIVVPDSGTGDLQGLTGTMTIDADAGHAYVLTYELG